MDIVDAKLCSIAICTLIECLSNLNEKTKQSRDQEDVKSVQSEVKDKVSLLSSSLVDIFDLAGSIDPFQSKNEKDLKWTSPFTKILSMLKSSKTKYTDDISSASAILHQFKKEEHCMNDGNTLSLFLRAALSTDQCFNEEDAKCSPQLLTKALFRIIRCCYNKGLSSSTKSFR